MATKRFPVDWPLVVVALLLSIYGISIVYSAGQTDIMTSVSRLWKTQVIWFCISLLGAYTVTRCSVRLLDWLTWPAYTLSVAMLVLLLFVGKGAGTAASSKSWLAIGGFRIGQPSELAKILLCVSLAAFVYERVRRPFGLGHTLKLLALGLVPAGLVLLQPDLGTGIVLVAIAVTILFVAGIPWQHFAAIGALAVLIAGGTYAAGSAVGIDFLHGYQEDRLTAFLHPSEDPSDASYQVNQAIIAVGSGEEVGRGDNATQTELLFLPERHTDFIFAVIGERFGFAGAAFVVLLYSVLFWRVIRLMRQAASFYGTLIAGGVLAMLAFQVIVNMGMNLGLLPVTGITLPLISYGGSSVIGTFLALGLLQSVYAESRAEVFQSR